MSGGDSGARPKNLKLQPPKDREAALDVVLQLAKYNVYRYIGCIIDQSNWSGPFSLVVMMPD